MPIYIFAEITAFIISLLLYRSLKKTVFSWFPFFLAITVLVEILAPLVYKDISPQQCLDIQFIYTVGNILLSVGILPLFSN